MPARRTLKMSDEHLLKEKVPEVKEVVAVNWFSVYGSGLAQVTASNP